MYNPEFPELESVVFMLMTFGLIIFLLLMVRHAMRSLNIAEADRRNTLRRIGIPLILWLGALRQLSGMHFFDNWSAVPPRIFFMVAPAMLVVILFMFSKKYALYLKATPAYWLVGIQSFRIIMEWVLWSLSDQGIVPVQMSWEGRNFDILSGIFGLILFLVMRKKQISGNLLLAYNFLGIGLLLNVLIIGLLSTPSPFRVFMNEPANTFIAYFPFCWLPAFVVPFAFLMHFSSIKKYYMEKNLLTT